MELALAKILIGFISENICYHSVNNMLPFSVLPKNIKINPHPANVENRASS